jgi:hypothetical protein
VTSLRRTEPPDEALLLGGESVGGHAVRFPVATVRIIITIIIS